MKKRLFAVLACCLSLLMVLSACGTQTSEPSSEPTAPAESGGDVASEPVLQLFRWKRGDPAAYV